MGNQGWVIIIITYLRVVVHSAQGRHKAGRRCPVPWRGEGWENGGECQLVVRGAGARVHTHTAQRRRVLSAISNAAACGACGQLQSSCYSSVLTSVILMGGCAILQAGQPCGDMISILPPMLMIMRPTVEDLADSGTKTKVICSLCTVCTVYD